MGQNWCKWQYKRLTGDGPHQVYAGPCVYGGVIVSTPVVATSVQVYDQATGAPDPLREVPGVRSDAYDGFVDTPIAMNLGITVTIIGTGAIAWILYDPV